MGVSPGVQALLEWIRAKIAAGTPGEILPTGQQLAVTFGLSRKTVNEQLKPLVRAGKLVRVPGKGTSLPVVDPAPPELAGPPGDSAGHLVQSMKTAMATGELRVGDPLPQVTWMCRSFKLTPATVRTAYRRLESEGFATRVGRQVWVGTVKQLVYPHTRKEVFLLMPADSDFGEAFRDDLFAPAYCKMERELSQHGYVLRFELLSRLSRLSKRWLERRTEPYGLIVHGASKALVEDIVPRLRELHDSIRRAHLPQVPVLLDARWAPPLTRLPHLHILSRGNLSTSGARTMARWLAEKGYTRVVLFLQDDAGLPAGQPAGFWNIVRGLKLPVELDDFASGLFLRTVLVTPGSHADVREFFAGVYGGLKPDHVRAVSSKYRPRTVEDFAAKTVLVGRRADAFAKCLDADVWVFSTTAAADEALSWCADHSVSVPRRVSIVSLENDPRFYHRGITCCEIDWEQVGYLMAHAIIGDFSVARTRRGYIRTRARIIERHTSR